MTQKEIVLMQNVFRQAGAFSPFDPPEPERHQANSARTLLALPTVLWRPLVFISLSPSALHGCSG